MSTLELPTVVQLRFTGEEVPLGVVQRYTRARQPPLTVAQATILRWARERGEIRSVEAGVIMHAARGYCGHGGRSHDWRGTPRAIGCCAYACADGLDALKRLADRGLVYRDPFIPGRWYAP